MGVVYEGWDPVIARKVAVKTLELELVPEEEREEVVQRFQRETRIVGTLDHPGVVTLFDSGVELDPARSPSDASDPVHYYVMERLEGRSLSAELREKSPLDPLRAVQIARSVAEVLDRAHEEGIIHRDIKPSNVFLRTGGGAVLLDFGIARSGAVALTQQGQILGTPSYLAPERLREKESPIDGRADQFSLGVLLYTMLVGKPPFVGSDMYDVIDKITKEAHPRLEASSEAGLALEAVVDRLLAKDPGKRFPSAGAVDAALEPVEAALVREGETETSPRAERLQDEGGSAPTEEEEGAATAIGPPSFLSETPVAGGGDVGSGDLVTDTGAPMIPDARSRSPLERSTEASTPAPLPLWTGEETVAETQAPQLNEEELGSDGGGLRGPRFEVSLVETDDVVVRPLDDAELIDEEEQLETHAEAPSHLIATRRPEPMRLEPEVRSAPDRLRMAVRVEEAAVAPGWRSGRRLLLLVGLMLSVLAGLVLGRWRYGSGPEPEERAGTENAVVAVTAEPSRASTEEPTARALLSDAEAARTAGEWERAAALYARAASVSGNGPATARALLGRADVLRADGQKTEALEAYRSVLALALGGPEEGQARVALEELGIVSRERRGAVAARRGTTRRRSPAPSRPPPRVEAEDPEDACRALLFRHARDPVAAVAAFELLARQHPKAPCARWNLGVKYERVGRLEAAVAAYRSYLELDPTSGRRAAVERRIQSLEDR